MATFKYYDKRVASIALVVIFFFLGGLSLYNVTQGIQGQREILSYESKIKRLEKSLVKSKKAREKVRKKLKGEEMRAIREGTAFVNKIIAKNAFPWDRLLDAIETSIPEGIILKELTVADDFETVQMKGVAGSSDVIDLLLSRLKKSGVFERNLLTKLSISEFGKNGAVRGNRKGMRFEIESKLSIEDLFSGKEYEGYLKVLKETFTSG
ncbi:MAG: PilN domain-containing protein [Deltaproteobacteria bacterium]|nr:PilN domain-containing protein [Deltaproteobacteria bacterium]